VLAPPPLPRNLEASFRDLASKRWDTRVSAIADVVRHAAQGGEVRGRALSGLEKLLDDADPRVRAAAAVGLGDLEAREVLPRLLVAVEDGDGHVRQMALNALGEIGDARAAPRLRRALHDERPEVRYQAVIAFAKVEAGDEAAAAIREALRDGDASVRYIAIRVAEEKIDGAPDDPSRRAWRDLGAAVAERVGDRDDHVAIAGAIFIAKLGGRGRHEAARSLIARVVRGELAVDKEDEREAVEVAGELAMGELVPALERRAWGVARLVRDTCAFHAKIALARQGHARAVADIARDLASPRREVRDAAVVSAGRARLVSLRERIASLGDGAVDPRLRADAIARLGEKEAP